MKRVLTPRRFTTRLIVIVRLAALLALVGAMAMPGTQAAAAVTQPDLLTATSFAVLAGTTVTNTGPTIIGPPVGAPVLGGDLGVSPGTAVTGFPPGIVVPPGVIHAADAVALQAKTDLVTAYNTLAGETPCTALPASVGTLTLTPGVYCFTSAALFTMPSLGLTLNLQGNPNSLFIFKIPSQLTTQSGYPVNFINGSAPCNVWWQVGSSATLGTTTKFVGNIVALTSISLATGATLLPGRALAQNGAVTLDTSTINMAGCLTLPPTSTPTNTLRPTATNTPQPTATNTPRPPPTQPAPTSTAIPALTLPAVAHLPSTGYPPPDQPSIAWLIPAAGGLLALMAGAWTFRRTKKRR
ncbi:MAG: ice-binding family protein [Aggregatilineales bacterium]